MIFFALCFTFVTSMEFTPYHASEQYKCGEFLQRRVEDKTLSYFYTGIDHFLSLLSTTFPHEDLLSRQALVGDLNEIRQSIETKYLDWWSWQKGWLITAGSFILLGILVPVLYIFYRCCVCCCGNSSRKQNTDSRCDGCKRNFLNIIMALIVLLDVFAATTLLITSQYAEYGVEELPNRLNYCIDDLNLYKRDTDARMRKLLIDDYQVVNGTLLMQLSTAGREVVQRVKKLTGANSIDILVNMSRSAEDIYTWIDDIRTEIREVADDYSRYEIDFGRMRNTIAKDLHLCLQDEVDFMKAMCRKAEKTLESMTPSQMNLDMEMISLKEAVDEIRRVDIPNLLDHAIRQFTAMQNIIQRRIDDKIQLSQGILKEIADNLFAIAEKISNEIRQLDFDMLYDIVSRVSDPNDSVVVKVLHHSRTFSLVVTSIFMLIAFCFLLGLFYGICGRRPTFYNDDCCVRSTGAKFYSCGTWLAITTFTSLSVLTACLMFAVGNTSDIVCRTLRDPLSRPDILSLGERYLEIARSRWQSKNELLSLMRNLTVVDIIRGCEQNETLYEIFELDTKFQLTRLKSVERDAYEKLEQFLNVTLTDVPKIGQFDSIISKPDFKLLQQLSSVNISEIDRNVLLEINSTISNMDIGKKAEVLEWKLGTTSGLPKAVTSMLEQVRQIEMQSARPIRLKLQTLYVNLTKLNKRIEETQVPISSLLGRLEHSQASLTESLHENLQKAAQDHLVEVSDTVEKYIDHVKYQMQHDVSSCAPLEEIVSSSASALCDYTIDPLNGVWMSMLICLLCFVVMLIFSTTLVRLYNNMHSYSKYAQEMPQNQHQMSSFITDTYEPRQKPGYTNYSYVDNYQRTFR